MTARSTTSTTSTGSATNAFLNVADFGAKMDGNYGTASMANGSNVLTKDSATINFVSADVGKKVLISGAGAGGVDLVTTIAGFTDSLHVTLVAAASTTVASERLVWGTDDAPAWQAAINECIRRRGGRIIATANPSAPFSGSNFTSLIGSQLNVTHWKGGSIMGSSGGGVAFPILSYLPATGSCLKATSCLSLEFDGLTFAVENRQYNGDLVWFASDGTDNMNCRVRGCGFFPWNTGGGGHPSPLNSHLRLDKAIFSYVEECSFGEGPVGSAIWITDNYNVACSYLRNNFSHTLRHIYLDSGDIESLTIEENTFEPCWGGTAGAITGSPNCLIRGGGSIKKNWFGDINIGGRCHIEKVYAYIGALEVANNFFGTPVDQAGTGFGGAHFNIGGGGPWDIHDNWFDTGIALFDMTPLSGALQTQAPDVDFHDNSYQQNNNIFINGSLSSFLAWRASKNHPSGSKSVPETDQSVGVVTNLTYPTHTPGSGDAGKLHVSTANPSALSFLVPSDTTTGYPVGTRLWVFRSGGTITFTADTGVTIRSRGGAALTLAQDKGAVALLVKKAANDWVLSGDIGPVGAAYTLNAGATSRNLASGATLTNVEQVLRSLIADMQSYGLSA